MPGWTGSDRRERLPENWPALRRECFKRAGGRCEWRLPSGKRCPRKATDCDHKIPGDDHRPTNLAALCSIHHDRKTAIDARRAKNARKKILRRPPERHPGDVRLGP